jgi:hypothetical protein
VDQRRHRPYARDRTQYRGKWRKRYFEQGIGGLADRKRPGRPRTFPNVVVAEVKAIARRLTQHQPLTHAA